MLFIVDKEHAMAATCYECVQNLIRKCSRRLKLLQLPSFSRVPRFGQF